MSKKSRKKSQAKKVLSSFADLGNTGKSALSRLATTVKADMPTVILGNKDPFAGTVKTDSIKEIGGGNKLSNFAMRLIPFRATPGAMQNKPAAARLKHIAGRMGNAAVPKTRKSKGIIWLFLFFAAVAGSGYYAWNSIDGIGEKITETIDYKYWLNKTAGKVKPGETTQSSQINIGNRAKPATRSQAVSTQVKKSPVATKTTVKTKTVSVKKVAKKSPKKASKKSVAASKASKNKKWESKLAKLKKKSEADYKKASVNYKKNHK